MRRYILNRDFSVQSFPELPKNPVIYYCWTKFLLWKVFPSFVSLSAVRVASVHLLLYGKLHQISRWKGDRDRDRAEWRWWFFDEQITAMAAHKRRCIYSVKSAVYNYTFEGWGVDTLVGCIKRRPFSLERYTKCTPTTRHCIVLLETTTTSSSSRKKVDNFTAFEKYLPFFFLNATFFLFLSFRRHTTKQKTS